MWRPMEIFLYDWWPIRAEARLFDRLSAMPVRIAYTRDATSEAWRWDWPAHPVVDGAQKPHVLIPHLVVAMILVGAAWASAQDPVRPRPAVDIFKRVVLDPTTYAPALISYESHHLDWKSSQVFFQHGFVEHSAEFTISGRANDRPISYAAGNRKIAATALASLGVSLANNIASAIVERALIERYPKHRKLTRTLGWVERISFASLLAYGESAAHFRQWRKNVQLAGQLGY